MSYIQQVIVYTCSDYILGIKVARSTNWTSLQYPWNWKKNSHISILRTFHYADSIFTGWAISNCFFSIVTTLLLLEEVILYGWKNIFLTLQNNSISCRCYGTFAVIGIHVIPHTYDLFNFFFGFPAALRHILLPALVRQIQYRSRTCDLNSNCFGYVQQIFVCV